MTKQNKRTKLEITWPTSHFTIQDIQNKYPEAKNITLRFRINRAVEDGLLIYIGKNDTKVGRPTIVYSPSPVSSDILQSAVNSGVILDEQFEGKVVDVATVSDSDTTQKSDVKTAKTVSV